MIYIWKHRKLGDDTNRGSLCCALSTSRNTIQGSEILCLRDLGFLSNRSTGSRPAVPRSTDPRPADPDLLNSGSHFSAPPSLSRPSVNFPYLISTLGSPFKGPQFPDVQFPPGLANVLFRDYSTDKIYRSLSEIDSFRQRGGLGLCLGWLALLFL